MVFLKIHGNRLCALFTVAMKLASELFIQGDTGSAGTVQRPANKRPTVRDKKRVTLP